MISTSLQSFAEFGLFLLSLLASPVPADAPKDAKPAWPGGIAAVAPENVLLVASVDLPALRRNVQASLGRVEAMNIPAFQQAFPASPRAELAAWQAHIEPRLRESLGLERAELQAVMDATTRLDCVLAQMNFIPLPTAAFVFEGPSPELSAKLFARLREFGRSRRPAAQKPTPANDTDTTVTVRRGAFGGWAGLFAEAIGAPPEITVADVEIAGRQALTIGLPDAVWALYAPADRPVLILATDLQLLKNFIRGMDAPGGLEIVPTPVAQPGLGQTLAVRAQDRGRLAGRLARAGLPQPPSQAPAWLYADAPSMTGSMMAVLNVMSRARINFGPNARDDRPCGPGGGTIIDTLTDLSAIGPALIAMGAAPDGGAVGDVRLPLPPDAEWRTWLGGKGFLHAATLAPPKGSLAAFSVGLADAPAFAKALEARWNWIEAMYGGYDLDRGKGDLLPFLRALKDYREATGETMFASAGRFREVGLTLGAPTDGLPPGFDLAMSSCIHLRFVDDQSFPMLWSLWRRMHAFAEALPELPKPDADGVVEVAVALPGPVRGTPLAVAWKGDRAVLSLAKPLSREMLTRAAPEGNPAADAFWNAVVDVAAARRWAASLNKEAVDAAFPEPLAALWDRPYTSRAAIDGVGLYYRETGPEGEKILAATLGAMLPSLTKSIDRSRQNALAAQSMNNLKQIGLGAHLYANDHNDALPGNFDEIKAYLGHNDATLLVCPATQKPYVYVAALKGFKTAEIKNPTRTPLAYSEPLPDGRRLVLFVDGHVQSLREQSFQNQLREAQNELAEEKTAVEVF